MTLEVDMRSAIALLLLGFAAPAICGGKDTVFSAPRDKVYAAALETVASEWRVEQADKESGVISFRSGMSMKSWKGQDLSLLVTDAEGGTKIIVNAEKRGGQIGTWGEGGKLAKKALRLIGERLHKDGLIPESEVPKK
jgi:hypothetical protein